MFARVVLILLILISDPLAPAQQKTLKVQGSDSMILFGQRMASVYNQRQKQKLQIQTTGGGATQSFRAVAGGSADVAQSSRPIKSSEQPGKALLEIPVAIEGVAVYVNQANALQEFTTAQLKQIFSGTITNWKELGGRDARIQLYSTESGFGGSLFFHEIVLNGGEFDTTMRGYDNTLAMIKAVADDPNGIGFGGLNRNPAVRTVNVKKSASIQAVAPTMENIRSTGYPLSRYLYWYVSGRPEGDLKTLLQWALSSEGQLVVEGVGFFPLVPADRAIGLARVGAGPGSIGQ